MANEAVPVEGPYEIHDFTVSDAVAIPQYTLMRLAGPRTASASSADSQVWAGIIMREKEADSGQTEMGLCTNGGIFVLTAGSDGIGIGELVSLSGTNVIKTATEAEVVTGDVIGKALEAIAANTTGEVKIGAI